MDYEKWHWVSLIQKLFHVISLWSSVLFLSQKIVYEILCPQNSYYYYNTCNSLVIRKLLKIKTKIFNYRSSVPYLKPLVPDAFQNSNAFRFYKDNTLLYCELYNTSSRVEGNRHSNNSAAKYVHINTRQDKSRLLLTSHEFRSGFAISINYKTF